MIINSQIRQVCLRDEDPIERGEEIAKELMEKLGIKVRGGGRGVGVVGSAALFFPQTLDPRSRWTQVVLLSFLVQSLLDTGLMNGRVFLSDVPLFFYE